MWQKVTESLTHTHTHLIVVKFHLEAIEVQVLAGLLLGQVMVPRRGLEPEGLELPVGLKQQTRRRLVQQEALRLAPVLVDVHGIFVGREGVGVAAEGRAEVDGGHDLVVRRLEALLVVAVVGGGLCRAATSTAAATAATTGTSCGGRRW